MARWQGSIAPGRSIGRTPDGPKGRCDATAAGCNTRKPAPAARQTGAGPPEPRRPTPGAYAASLVETGGSRLQALGHDRFHLFEACLRDGQRLLLPVVAV